MATRYSRRLNNKEEEYLAPTRTGVYPPCRSGRGISYAHHGEIFQGVVEGLDGRLHRVLVSLPCNIFHSRATFTPDASGVVRVTPHWKSKAHRAIELMLSRTDRRGWGGLLEIDSNVPIGWGLGSSTSDIMAAILAFGDALGERITPAEMGAIAVSAEKASDSVMFNYPLVLFANREGIVLEEFSGQLPLLEVLGFNTDFSEQGINTLDFAPARYTSWEIEAFRPLVGLLRCGIETQNAAFIGRVATASACINQRRLSTLHFDSLLRIMDAVGALGLQVAHSGTVAGFLFDPNIGDKELRLSEAQSLINELGFCESWHFRTGANNPEEGINKK